jgi:hypothetical protein
VAGRSRGWPTGRPFAQTALAKSVETRLCPYISPPTAEDSGTDTTCSSPLVKVSI